MSNGDVKDSVKFSIDKDSPKRKKRRSGIDDFAHAIARIAVAQVCEGLGFQGFHHSALDALADVGVRYAREVGKVASSYANLANRSECNVFDVIQGLEDLGFVQGFSGASDVGRSVSNSGVIKDITRYVCKTDEIPFAYAVPGFPVVKDRSLALSFAQAKENPPDECIPSWLPKFPDPATYAESNSGDEKDLETRGSDKTQQVDMQYGTLENSSQNLQQQNLVTNWSEAGVALEQGDTAKAQRAAESNPFLAPPLQFGDKEVSLPVLPAKLLDATMGNRQGREIMENHVSVREPTLQVKEASGNGTCVTEDRKCILLNGRPSVHFKFGDGKKSLGMNTIPHKEGIQKISFWFSDDHDGIIEKESRTEQILPQNMDHDSIIEKESSPEQIHSQNLDHDGIIEKESRAEQILSQNTDHDSIKEKESSPEKIHSQNMDHDGIIEKESRAEQIFSQNTDHDSIIEKESSPEQIHSQNTDHDGIIEKESRAEQILSQNMDHDSIIEKESRSEQILLQNMDHDSIIEKETSPEQIHSQNMDPDGIIEKESRAEQILSQNMDHDSIIEKESRAEQIHSQNMDHDSIIEKKSSPEQILSQNMDHDSILENESSPEQIHSQNMDHDSIIEKKSRAEQILSENMENP